MLQVGHIAIDDDELLMVTRARDGVGVPFEANAGIGGKRELETLHPLPLAQVRKAEIPRQKIDAQRWSLFAQRVQELQQAAQCNQKPSELYGG